MKINIEPANTLLRSCSHSWIGFGKEQGNLLSGKQGEKSDNKKFNIVIKLFAEDWNIS